MVIMLTISLSSLDSSFWPEFEKHLDCICILILSLLIIHIYVFSNYLVKYFIFISIGCRPTKHHG